MNLVDDREIQRFEDDGNKVEPRIGVSLAESDAILRDARPDRPRHRDRRLALIDSETPVHAKGQPQYSKDDRGGEWINLDGKWITRQEFEALYGNEPHETIHVNRERRISVPPLPNGAKLIIPAGPNTDVADETPKILDDRGEEVSSLTWKGFLAWRKTKCRPFQSDRWTDLATKVSVNESDRDADAVNRRRALEEIDQATHEFVGEVAELGQLFLEVGPATFFGEKRDKLIDECGDILFCGVWALDAWGVNPLYEADDLELLRVDDDSDLAQFARAIIAHGEAVLTDRRFVSMMGGLVMNLMLQAQTNAGLTSNAFKKLRFQRREQDVNAQVTRILSVLVMVNQILIVANSSVEEALKVNQRKLDARYPNGYQSGQGGGIRTGEGK